ncbi:MAG: YezD family protein [Candidatus Methylacidiphilales bacterium]|nr:YezD family protein [Candidatus Methylacidiphilales bacterium]
MSARQNRPDKATADATAPPSGTPHVETANGKNGATTSTGGVPTVACKPEDTEMVRRILRALSGLDYGSVEIIVQDSRVVQIERTQRSRFSRPLEIPQPPPAQR